jgi:molybdopterin/thiamine biosynthesis adenylyltransferase
VPVLGLSKRKLGMGHGIMDNDTVALQNLHRQVLYTKRIINEAKVVPNR